MSLFFKEGRERGEAVAYYLAWGAGREERGEDGGRRLQWKCTTCRKPGSAAAGALRHGGEARRERM